MMIVWSLLEADATVAARSWTRLVQVDEDLRVTQWSSSSVAYSYPTMNQSHGLLSNHFHSTERLRLKRHICLFKARDSSMLRSSLLVGAPFSGSVGSLTEDGSGRWGYNLRSDRRRFGLR